LTEPLADDKLGLVLQTMDQSLKNLVIRGHIYPSLALRLAREAKDFRGFLKNSL